MTIPPLPDSEDLAAWRTFSASLITISATKHKQLSRPQKNDIATKLGIADKVVTQLIHKGFRTTFDRSAGGLKTVKKFDDPGCTCRICKTPVPGEAPTLEIFGKTLQVGESITVPVKVKPKPPQDGPVDYDEIIGAALKPPLHPDEMKLQAEDPPPIGPNAGRNTPEDVTGKVIDQETANDENFGVEDSLDHPPDDEEVEK
jgi:hypothetical protein